MDEKAKEFDPNEADIFVAKVLQLAREHGVPCLLVASVGGSVHAMCFSGDDPCDPNAESTPVCPHGAAIVEALGVTVQAALEEMFPSDEFETEGSL